MAALEVMACLLATALADVRWLRVAQREHYIAGSVSRFVNRWWYGIRLNIVLWLIALVALVAGFLVPEATLAIAVVVAVGPLGLSLRGRTSKLVWTRRLKTLAAITAVLQLVVVGVAAVFGGAVLIAGLVAAIAPTFVDIACAIAAPLEERKAQRFVDDATKRLKSINPLVVGITGSYGKTGTKQYVAHLLSGSRSVLATPASFNNRAGLSRSINENLTPGTDVFVAEMGTYGVGEIAELCRLCPPEIAVFTAVGPVHLERFGSEAVIVEAKSEIFEPASVCVLNVDDARLAEKADELETAGKKVWRCGSNKEGPDVRVVATDELTQVWRSGELVGEIGAIDAPPTNAACAIAVALELGVAIDVILAKLSALPVPQHRQEVAVTEAGVTVIDDTFNANPASVERGLALLAANGVDGAMRVVVTPGMVELGARQAAENHAFGEAAAQVATDVIVVGRTNRQALVEGVSDGGGSVVVVRHLPEAVAWVREHVGTGGVVLYANDLPDHFP